MHHLKMVNVYEIARDRLLTTGAKGLKIGHFLGIYSSPYGIRPAIDKLGDPAWII